MFEIKPTSPTVRQLQYSNLHCTNPEWRNRGRCTNKSYHRQLHVWRGIALPRHLDAVEWATLTVKTVGDRYEPGGCGPLWSAAATLCELDARGALQNLSVRQVAWLLAEDRRSDPYPLRGLEILRLLDSTYGAGIDVWCAALSPNGRRSPARLGHLLTSGPGWAARRRDYEPVRAPAGLDL